MSLIRLYPGQVEKSCVVCGIIFFAWPSEIARKSGKICTRNCYQTVIGGDRPLEERFWKKVNRNGPIPAHCPELGPCWVWTGAIKGGYGIIMPTRGSKQMKKAHHIGWELQHGPFSQELCILHKCDNPLCVRWSHLMIGDRAANNQDKANKGRQVILHGEQIGTSKLTWAQVRDARRRHAEGTASAEDLANETHTSYANMCRVLKGNVWRDN